MNFHLFNGYWLLAAYLYVYCCEIWKALLESERPWKHKLVGFGNLALELIPPLPYALPSGKLTI